MFIGVSVSEPHTSGIVCCISPETQQSCRVRTCAGEARRDTSSVSVSLCSSGSATCVAVRSMVRAS